MPVLTIDIACSLPPKLRDLSISTAEVFNQRMADGGVPSVFKLGDPFPGRPADEVCEPHVSLFMLAISDADLPDLLSAVSAVVAGLRPIDAKGTHFSLNPLGAPELFYERVPDWFALQTALVAAAAPLRRARLRETDPAGDRLSEVVTRLRADGSDPSRLRQLVRYGYDEVSDKDDDRFRPHITFAWPRAPYQVDLSGLPDPDEFSGRIDSVGVYGMQPNGTCTKHYQTFTLGAPSA